MSSSNLSKKRARPAEPLTITLGKLSPHRYYYISDSLSVGSTKIKISMVDLSNTKEEKQISLKEHEEENDTSLDILNLNRQLLRDELPKIINDIKSNEMEQIYLPISSSWFNMDNIHEIEIKSLPEFFCGKFPSKTPQVYKNYRNFIINLYRENSTMYLSSTTCRKRLPGDACAILRIHAFLEHWGLINFKQKIKPSFIPKAFNFKSPIYINTDLFMLDNTNNNTNKKDDNIVNYNNPEISIVLNNNKKTIATLYPINKISNKLFNDFIDNLKNMNNDNDNNDNSEQNEKKYQKINFLMENYRPKCDICKNFCTINWYTTKEHYLRAKNNEDEKEEIDSSNDLNVSINIDEKSLNGDFCLICEECFLNNEIPLPNNLKREYFEPSSIYNLFSKEKYNAKIADKLNKEKWTNDENNKLKEGIKNKKNWEEIIQSFGTNTNKTKKDCILHLLQMPMNNMEEKYGNKNDELMDEEDIDGGEEEGGQNVESEEIKNDEKMKKFTKNNQININENEENENEDNIGGDNNISDNNNINNIDEDKIDEEENKNESDNNKRRDDDKMNNNMIEIFMRLFRRYLNESSHSTENKGKDENRGSGGDIANKTFKEVIYKTFAKSINKCRELKNEEKNEMKNIVDILVYLEMKKIELKMNYFKQFERVLEYKKNQLKTIETQIIQERIKLITKKLLLQQRQQQANENK
jgi:hypothetical protein